MTEFGQDTEWVHQYLDYIDKIKKYSPHTVNSYTQDIVQFYEFVFSESNSIDSVKHIRLIHIRNWMSELALNNNENSTLKRKKSALNSYFKYLQKNNYIDTNLIQNVPTPPLKKRIPNYLDAQATENIQKNFFDIDFQSDWKKINGKIFIILLYCTGIRRAELCNLKSQNINYSQNHITVIGKGNKTRIIPIPETLNNILNLYENEKKEKFPEHNSEFFFITHTGQDIYNVYIHRLVQENLSQITTINKKSPHVLRHTYATELLNNGADISAIKDLLGHSSLAATQIYTHTNIENLKNIFKKSHPRN